MAEYTKLPTHQLHMLQSTHIKFCELNQEVCKRAAEDFFLEYHHKILLSLEY
ncbi:hypothetical protein VP01_452g5 [Puccinia sorghi]|uniref:Uncharacterized protein n=1 Tax=Puccinia sorghi TaxID=27349 RepID=A0A0L6UNX8_9BASI|nr:hypothetical protein VP01_452g5 [Puccinia sorghi]